MKQTNNAIKFLMAQYRAIFKKAYLSGVASAVVLTAGLAAGSAQAAVTLPGDLANSGSISFDDSNKLQANIDSDLKWNADVTVSGSANNVSHYISNTSTSTKTSLTGSGSLTLSGSAPTLEVSIGAISQNKDFEVKIDKVNVSRGILKAGNANASSSPVASGAFIFEANSFIVGGLGLETNSGTSAVLEVSAHSADSGDNIIFGRANKYENNNLVVGSTITVANGGIAKFEATNKSSIDIEGESLKVEDGGYLLTKATGSNGSGAVTIKSHLTEVGQGGFWFVSGATTTNSNTTNIEGGLLVSGGNLTISPDPEYFDPNATQKDTKNVGTFTLKAGSTTQLHNSITLSGSSGGRLIVEDGAQLVRASGATAGSGAISVIGNAKFTSELESPTLQISSKTLSDYLAGGADYHEMVYNSTSGTITVDDQNVKQSEKGAIFLKSGGVLELSDAGVDLSETFSFASSGSFTANDAGKIIIDSGYSSVGIIKGQDLTISHALREDHTKANSTAVGTNLIVETDNLTLGNDQDDISGSLGYHQARASDSVTFKDKDGNFSLANTVVLDRDYYTQNLVEPTKSWETENTFTRNNAGVIQGADIDLISNGGGGGGALSVTGGEWNSEINMKITSGTLTVGSTPASVTSTPNNYKNNGNAAYLRFADGQKLTLSGASSTAAKVNVTGAQGANATLDMLTGNFEWGNGSVTVNGNAIKASAIQLSGDNCNTQDPNILFASEIYDNRVGFGRLFLNATDFQELLEADSSQVGTGPKLNIGEGGYVYVNGSISGKHDFTKFSSQENQNNVNFVIDSNQNTKGSMNLVIDGNLNLFTPDANPLEFGAGTIYADNIRIDNEHKDSNQELDKKVQVQLGKFVVSQGIRSINDVIEFKNDYPQTGGQNTELRLALNADKADETLTLSNDFVFGKLAKLQVSQGKWVMANNDLTLDGGMIRVGTDSTEVTNELLKADSYAPVSSLIADNLEITSATTFADKIDVLVHDGSAATFNTMQTKFNARIDVEGHMTIEGLEVTEPAQGETNPAWVNKGETAGIDFVKGTTFNVKGLGASLAFGKVATSALVKEDSAAPADTISYTLNDELLRDKGASFYVDDFAELKLSLNDTQIVDKEDAQYLVKELLGTTQNTGYLNLGDAQLKINEVARTDGKVEYKWEELKPFVQITAGKATTDRLKSALVSGINSDIRDVRGHYGALKVDFGQKVSLNLAGPTSLHNANAFGGYFVFTGDETNPKEINVKLDQHASLGLQNGGKIGAIEGNGEYGTAASYDSNSVFVNGNGAKTEILGNVDKLNEFNNQGETEISGHLYANELNVKGVLSTVSSDTENVVHTDGGLIYADSTLNTNLLKVGNFDNRKSGGYMAVMGTVNAANVELFHSDVDVVDGLTKIKGDLNMTSENAQTKSKSELTIGYHPESSNVVDDKYTEMVETQAYTGAIEVLGASNLNGGQINLTPDYSVTTAYASLNNLTGATTDKPHEAGLLDGSAFIGGNSVLGIGSENLEHLQNTIAKYNGNSQVLNEDGLGAALYIGKKFTLASDKGITLTAQKYEDFIKYFNEHNSGTVAVADLSTDFACDQTVKANTLFLGDNTALIIDAGAMDHSKALGDGTNGVITFTGHKDTQSNTYGQGLVVADGGEIVVDGNVRANQYQVFSNAKIVYLDGTDYRPTDSNSQIVAKEGKDIYVSTENDFLHGYVESNGAVDLRINKNARAIMSKASNPVFETLVAYARGYNGPEPEQSAPVSAESKAAEEPALPPVHPVSQDRWLYTLDQDGNPDYLNYHNSFLQQTISTGDGSAAETVARLGVYGGAAQVALAAGNTTTEAISGRMGMGMNTALTQADNGQGAGMWVSPIYRSSDSDGFGAQGVNYGVDVDIYGVALGGDFTMANGLRVGAMFNVGSGSADGKDAGANVSNDFNYYGFGAYVGYTMNQFSVMGDISYTVADNDVDSNTSIEKVNTSLDSTNLSLGVTGQYTLSLGNDLTVVPHAGLRFSKIDLDNYTVKGSADVAHFSAESLNVFSVPVGVTLAKDYVGEEWTVKPSLDITLTGNFGDDSLDGDVKWTGVENLVTKTSSEVLDSFTYGATAGFSAKNGNFSMGLGVSYTGSSNTDEFGLNANARFLF